jgi:hypothetical protein
MIHRWIADLDSGGSRRLVERCMRSNPAVRDTKQRYCTLCKSRIILQEISNQIQFSRGNYNSELEPEKGHDRRVKNNFLLREVKLLSRLHPRG